MTCFQYTVRIPIHKIDQLLTNNFSVMIVKTAFNVLFYCGSFVNDCKYGCFLDSLIERYNCTVSLVKPFESVNSKIRNNSILIGHSFGGSFALKDALQYSSQVDGIVLINSHLNSRWKMPYPPFPATKVTKPLLSILAGDDDYLPLNKGLDDLYEKINERYANHFYYVNENFDHFTGIANNVSTDIITSQVASFVDAVLTRNFSTLRANTQILEHRFQCYIDRLSTNAIIHSNPFGVMDALVKLMIPRFFWNFMRWISFLSATPDCYVSHMFEDSHHVYWKSCNDDIDKVEYVTSLWTNSSDSIVQTIHVNLTSLCTCALGKLLWHIPLFPYVLNDTVNVPYVCVEKQGGTRFHKIVHPHRVFHALPNPLK